MKTIISAAFALALTISTVIAGEYATQHFDKLAKYWTTVKIEAASKYGTINEHPEEPDMPYDFDLGI